MDKRVIVKLDVDDDVVLGADVTMVLEVTATLEGTVPDEDDGLVDPECELAAEEA